MKSGLYRGTVIFALLLSVAWVCGAEETLFINGEAIGTALCVTSGDGAILVPLAEFGLLIGLEAEAIDGGERIVMRWNGGRDTVSRHELSERNGTRYISLAGVVGLVGGNVHRLGEASYIETDIAALNDFDVVDGRIVLRFDGFVPDEIVEVSKDSLRIRFHHCRLSLPARSIVLAEGAIAEARLVSLQAGACELVMRLRQSGEIEVRRHVREGFFSVSLGFASEVSRETLTRVVGGMTVREVEVEWSNGLTRINAITIGAWRDRYRLCSSIPETGIGTKTSLAHMAGVVGADLAIGAGSSIGLCVANGVPICMDGGGHRALCTDLFGRLSLLEPDMSLYLDVSGISIPVDGVNRPIGYGEVTAYSPGYVGQSARGVPGTFTVIKIRSGRIVSVYNGTFVFEDPTATLIVASGEAKARLSLLFLGDRAELVCIRNDDGARIREAIGVGPILIEAGVAVDGAMMSDSAGRPQDPDTSLAWSLLVTDRHGGLTLVSVVRDGSSGGATLSELLGFLRSLPVPMYDAIVLHSGATSSLVYRDDRSFHELSSEDLFPIGLCLIPISQ